MAKPTVPPFAKKCKTQGNEAVKTITAEGDAASGPQAALGEIALTTPEGEDVFDSLLTLFPAIERSRADWLLPLFKEQGVKSRTDIVDCLRAKQGAAILDRAAACEPPLPLMVLSTLEDMVEEVRLTHPSSSPQSARNESPPAPDSDGEELGDASVIQNLEGLDSDEGSAIKRERTELFNIATPADFGVVVSDTDDSEKQLGVVSPPPNPRDIAAALEAEERQRQEESFLQPFERFGVLAPLGPVLLATVIFLL
eukprot:TRINITY_DN15838_c0_g1_i1.p1 TRINITY_DN15838_c0_g1~~TRINITY_DN15838_c0_g1_i1.p1  ORF type:complete len:254 (-),score=73.83 TRINITY_DN15838_c0_g1_i1:92-853(-)